MAQLPLALVPRVQTPTNRSSYESASLGSARAPAARAQPHSGLHGGVSRDRGGRARRPLRHVAERAPHPGRHGRADPSPGTARAAASRSEEHTSELQSRLHLVCRLLLEKKKKNTELYKQ